jgi:hypothetical protein
MEMSRIRYLAGWVARTRPFAEPLSPRGPQPVVAEHRGVPKKSQWADGSKNIGTGVLVLRHSGGKCWRCNWLNSNSLEALQMVFIGFALREASRSALCFR